MKRQAARLGNRNTGNAGGPRAGVCSLGWVNSGNAPGNSNGNNFGSRISAHANTHETACRDHSKEETLLRSNKPRRELSRWPKGQPNRLQVETP